MEPLPAQSFMQEYLSAGKLEHPNPGWNMLLPWRLRGPLVPDALRRGLDTVVARHEVLRTGLGRDGGRPVQLVRPHAPVPLPVVDLRGLADADRASTLDRIARRQHAISFRHADGPLLAAKLVRVADQDHYLLTTVDHAVCDGWSIGVILAELSAVYSGQVAGRDRRLWPLPAQYRDFAVRQRELAMAGGFDRQLDYWAGRLARPGPLGLDCRPAAADPAGGYRSGQVPVHIPTALAGRLRGLGQRHRVTLFMTLLAALSAVLARHAERGDVAVTTLAAGRKQAEYQRLVGLFANAVVLRTALAGAGSFAELLGRVKRTVLDAFGRQDAPFPLVAERTGVTGAEIWLNVAPPPPRSRFRDLEVDTRALPRDYPIDVPAGSWRGEKLICNLTDTGAEIVGLLDYNTLRLERPAIEELAAAFLAVLRDAVDDPSRALPPVGGRGPLFRAGSRSGG
jgi:hypothetical protein